MAERAFVIRKIFIIILQNVGVRRTAEMAKMGNRGSYWAVVWCKLPKRGGFTIFRKNLFKRG